MSIKQATICSAVGVLALLTATLSYSNTAPTVQPAGACKPTSGHLEYNCKVGAEVTPSPGCHTYNDAHLICNSMQSPGLYNYHYYCQRDSGLWTFYSNKFHCGSVPY